MLVAPLVLGLVLGAGSHLDEGERALDALDYDHAKIEFDQARSEWGLARERLLRVLEHQGQVEAILGHRDAAIADFRELLNLDPDHAAPDGWAPKVKTPFFEAKSWQAEQPPLQLKEGVPTIQSGQVTELIFELAADPLGLARMLRVHLAGATPVEVALSAPGVARASITPAAAVRYWAELLDEHQATLVQLGDGDHPRQVGAAPPSGSTASIEASSASTDTAVLPIVGLVVGGAGVAAGIVGAVLGLKVQSDQNQLTTAQRNSSGVVTGITRAQAIQLDSESRTDATVADVLFVASGVAVAAGVGLWVKGAFFTATPEPGGAAVAVAMRWP